MVFNGDGETVQIDFDEELAKFLGLPAGHQTATYTFYTGNLPPHGYVPTRYDAAMMLGLTIGEGEDTVSTMVEVGEYKEGQFLSGTNCTTADRITLNIETSEGERESVDFLKS